MIRTKQNMKSVLHHNKRRERDASHLTETTKVMLADSILAMGGDDSAVYVPFSKAAKVIDVLHRNFGHRTINSEDVAIYNPADDVMTRFAKIALSAIEAEQIEDGINKKVISNAAVITRGSPEQDRQALTNELVRRGGAQVG